MPLRILILTPRIPYPLKDGGSMAMYQVIEQYLAQNCEVSLLSMNTLKHWVDENSLPSMFSKLDYFETIRVDTDINKVDALINLFSKKSYNINRFVSKEFSNALEKVLSKKQFDIIQFESLYTSPYLDQVKSKYNTTCVCRVHNIECEIWDKLANHEKQLFKRTYIKLLSKRLRKFEIDQLNKFDILLPISPLEKSNLKQLHIHTPTYYLPYCMNVMEYENDNKIFDANSIYHIGSMDWQPNVEALNWFLDHCWQYIKDVFPFLYFYIAGKNMPTHFFTKKINGVEIIGEIDNATHFHLEKNICIIPLQSGAGVRIKVLEAMSLGKTIISTSIGCEGIQVTDGENILIANTPEEFVIALKLCFTNKDKCKFIGEMAKKFIEEHYQFEKTYSTLIHYLEGKAHYAK